MSFTLHQPGVDEEAMVLIPSAGSETETHAPDLYLLAQNT